MLLTMFASVVLSLAGVLLTWMGIQKIRGFPEFAGAVEEYGLKGGAKTVAVGWIALEVAAGLLLLVPFSQRAALATAVLGAATGAVARRATQGKAHDCGCGHGFTRTTSPRAVIGNSLVIGGVAALAFAASPEGAVAWVSAGAAAAGFMVGMAAVGRDEGSADRPISGGGPQEPMTLPLRAGTAATRPGS